VRRGVGPRGLALIKHFEGCRLEAYQDSGGVWTIGYGHTRAVKPGDRITDAQAESLLRADLANSERSVGALVRVPLSQAQFDALVSFEFNTGGLELRGKAGKPAPSMLLRLVNDERHLAVPEQLCRWRHDNGRELKGLIRRRVAEAALYLED
jgi:lysozyme